MVGPVAKREAVAHLQAELGLSERRACYIVSADRKMVRYQSRRPPDTELRGQLRELANARRRFGYRRLFVLLRKLGEPSGLNRVDPDPRACCDRDYRRSRTCSTLASVAASTPASTMTRRSQPCVFR